MVTHMDRGIGQVLELLSRLRLAMYTLVIFTSDNGAGHKTGLAIIQRYRPVSRRKRRRV